MNYFTPRYAAPLAGIIALAVVLAWAGYKFAEKFYIASETEASARRALPYLTSLISVMERYQNLPPILSEDVEVIRAAAGEPSSAINKRLARFAAITRAEAVYLMDRSGKTIAASNWDNPKTFLGHNYGFRPYFKDALSGGSGEFFAIGATTGKPGYFVSHPVKNAAGEISGVIAAKVDLHGLESGWQSPEGQIFITNADGVIVLSGENSWRYRTIGALTPSTRKSIAMRRQFGNEALEPLAMKRDGQSVTINQSRYIEHSADVGRLGWTLHFLSPYERVHERSRLVIAAAVVAFSLLMVFFIFRHSERIRAMLISSQQERDKLNRLNQELASEVEERIQAEKRLQLAQRELRQSSKLAALGQLAASVTHELGQPLSAMKTYIAGGLLPGADPGENGQLLHRLDRLVERMSETTRQLRFFARRGGEAFDDVELADVIAGALETMRPAIDAESVELVCRGVDQHIHIRGGRMRLEQVLVNLIRNALDAMRESDDKKLCIEMRKSENSARIIISDSGEGLIADHETRIFEPFVTTKASGEGLGLGLAISASIVKEHGGSLAAGNIEGGGAEFTLELPLANGYDHAPE